MSSQTDWMTWLLAAAVVAVFVWYFASAGRRIWTSLRYLVAYIESAPARRRAAAEAEAKAGGPPPLWLRAARALSLTLLIVMLGVLLWNRLATP